MESNRNRRRRAALPRPGAPRLALLVLALAGVAGAAPPQQEPASPPAGFGERIEVELVDVDVWVTDRQGRPVHGLTAGDFQLLHDGEPVPISLFSEVGGEPVAASPAVPGAGPAAAAPEDAAVRPAAAIAESRHLILYFDQLRLGPAGYRNAIEGVHALLDTGVVPAEQVLILSQDRDLHLEAPFGSSAEELRAALDRVAANAGAGLSTATEIAQAKEAIVNAWEQSSSMISTAQDAISAIPSTPVGGGSSPSDAVGGGGGSGGGAGPSPCDLFLQRVQPIVEGWVQERSSQIAVTLRSLSTAAAFLAGLPGAKTLVYVSDGLDVEPGAAIAAAVGDICPIRSGDAELRSLAETMTRQFRTLARRFNRYRVTVHTIQASGGRLGTSGSASERGSAVRSAGRLESRQRQSDRSGMSLLADETGGRAVFNQNDLQDELVDIGREMSAYYSLAYAPPPGGGPEHRIEVRVPSREVTLRHRQGYRDTTPDERMNEQLAGALQLGITRNPLALRLGVGETPTDASAPLHFFAIVPLDRLLFEREGDEQVAHLDLRSAVRTAGAAELRTTQREYRVRRPEGAAEQEVSLPFDLQLGPGSHLLAVGVRDRASGDASFVTTSLQLGGP